MSRKQWVAYKSSVRPKQAAHNSFVKMCIVVIEIYKQYMGTKELFMRESVYESSGVECMALLF